MNEQTEQKRPKKKSLGPFDFLKRRGKAWLLVVGVILGAALLIFGAGYGESDTEAESTLPLAVGDAEELEDYKDALEKRIGKLCDAVSGVSSVEVLVTLESGYRTVYATDKNGEPAKVGSGSGQQALDRALEPPAVSGVAVVCRGGDQPAVQRKLTDLLSTALGISSNRVCVAGK